MQPQRKAAWPAGVKLVMACTLTAVLYYGYHTIASDAAAQPEGEATPVAEAAKNSDATPAPKNADGSVDLTEKQMDMVKVQALVSHAFRVEKYAVGNVVYQDKALGNTPPARSGVKFLVANVHETDSPAIHVGQEVNVTLSAYPDRVFTGKVSTVGVTVYDTGGNPAVDPATHRIAVRCEIIDPKNELYPGMLATVAIEVDKAQNSPAIPKNGVVREGDGTMTLWITTDRKHFDKRTVKTGLQQDGFVQILSGAREGELAATDNAVFLSNIGNSDGD